MEREYEFLISKPDYFVEIVLQGMIAANKDRENRGYNVIYTETDFVSLINKYGVGDNNILTYRDERLNLMDIAGFAEIEN